jgi:signal peptidase I
VKKKQGYAYYRKEYSKKGYRRVFRIVFIFFLFCSGLQLVKTFFIDIYSVKNISMEPTFHSGTNVVVSPLAYGIRNPVNTEEVADFISTPGRGDLVVLVSPAVELQSWILRYIDQYLRFFSFQKLSYVYRHSNEWGSAFQVKRIIALPGEMVYLKNYTAFIKKPDSDNYISEFLMSKSEYKVHSGEVDGSLAPFSTDMDPIVLTQDQYFVLGDNRPYSLDSRNYGPVFRERLVGKILFSY